MGDDINRKRAYVSDLYSSPGWKRKVKNMSDNQVVAIYLDKQAKGDKPKPKEEPKNDIPF